MMKPYKILWIDDEFEKMKLFSDEAKAHGIILVGYKSYEEAFENFASKLFKYDAILLDAQFYKSKNQVGGSEDLKGLSAAKEKIAEFRKQRNIPVFILSGQTKLDNNETFSDTYGEHYRKQNPNDVVRLFTDIISASDTQTLTQIRHKYEEVFDVCVEKYVGETASKYLIDILCILECPDEQFDDEKYFNGIRKVVELVFRASNKLGLLHDKCIQKDMVNLSWSSLFMAGKQVELKPSTDKIICDKNHFPLLLANNVKSIIDITNAASHTEGEEKENGKVNFTEYKKHVTSNYLLYSLAFQVMDLLLWFKKYADENPDKEKNKLLWKSTGGVIPDGSWIKGEITRIAENGFGTFQPSTGGKTLSIIPARVKEYNLHEKQIIEVTITPDSAGTKHLIQAIREI